MFRSFGLPEIIVILVIVIILFGVGKLPEIGKGVGTAIREFRGSVKDKDENAGKGDSEDTSKA